MRKVAQKSKGPAPFGVEPLRKSRSAGSNPRRGGALTERARDGKHFDRPARGIAGSRKKRIPYDLIVAPKMSAFRRRRGVILTCPRCAGLTIPILVITEKETITVSSRLNCGHVGGEALLDYHHSLATPPEPSRDICTPTYDPTHRRRSYRGRGRARDISGPPGGYRIRWAIHKGYPGGVGTNSMHDVAVASTFPEQGVV